MLPTLDQCEFNDTSLSRSIVLKSEAAAARISCAFCSAVRFKERTLQQKQGKYKSQNSE